MKELILLNLNYFLQFFYLKKLFQTLLIFFNINFTNFKILKYCKFAFQKFLKMLWAIQNNYFMFRQQYF